MEPTEAIWEEVKHNTDWDHPTEEVIVAIVRCENIARHKLSQLASDKEWLELDDSSKRAAVPGFGKRATRLLESQIASYEHEAACCEDSVRRAKRDSLVSSLTKIIQPAQEAVVGHHRTTALRIFEHELEAIAADGVSTFVESVRKLKATVLGHFDEGCRDASISPQTMGEKTLAEMRSSHIREQFRWNLDRHTASVQAQKVSQIVSQSEKRLEEAIRASADSLLDAGRPFTWPSLRKLLSYESKRAVEEFAAKLAGFELDKENETKLVSQLRAFGRKALRKFMEDKAHSALNEMNYRFISIFCWNGDGITWTKAGEEDVRAIVKYGRTKALKLLSVLAAIRLEDNSTDAIESALLTLLEDNQEASTSGRNTSAESTVSSLLAASSWDGVAPEDTLLTPVECRVIWNKFKSETEIRVDRQVRVQEIMRRDKSSFPPTWA